MSDCCCKIHCLPSKEREEDRKKVLLDRFMAKTERDPETGCLMWTGAQFTTGYGKFHLEKRRSVTAHRWIFIQKHGHAPPVVRHTCDTPLCVDWENHLVPGTQGDNIRDAVERKRFTKQGDVCSKGHSRWGIDIRGHRKCLECRRLANARYRKERSREPSAGRP